MSIEWIHRQLLQIDACLLVLILYKTLIGFVILRDTSPFCCSAMTMAVSVWPNNGNFGIIFETSPFQELNRTKLKKTFLTSFSSYFSQPQFVLVLEVSAQVFFTFRKHVELRRYSLLNCEKLGVPSIALC